MILVPFINLQPSDFDLNRRISTHQGVWRDIFKHDAGGRYDRAGADRHAGRDERSRCDPDAVIDFDRRDLQFEILAPKIVTPGAKISSLTDANIRFDGDLRQAQNTNIFSDPDVIADGEPPGERDVHIFPDDDAGSDFRVERSQ